MKQDFLAKQEAYFDKFSADFDFTETIASRYEFASFVGFMGNNLQGKRILDLGCGCGRFGIKLASLTSAEVTGIDISEVSVEKANAFAQKHGITNFHAIKDDFKDIQSEGHYDFIVCINMLHHTNERNKIAENVFKSLKPGGSWIIIENNPFNGLFIPFFVLIGQLRAHLSWAYLASNKYSLKKLVKSNIFQIAEIQRYGFLPTMLCNYSSIFITANKILNKLPLINEFAAFHLIKATRP